MKRLSLSLRAAGLAILLVAPVAAFAQSGPPPDAQPAPGAAGTPNPQRFAAMAAMRSNLEALHRQTRAQMLGALTPQQRAQLATIVGQLAIAPAPQPDVAARQINALLSANQARTILSAEQNERSNVRALFESARSSFESSLTPAERTAMASHMARAAAHPSVPSNANANDPGFVLLHTALGVGGPFMGFHGR